MYTWRFDILILAELRAKNPRMESCSHAAVAQYYNMAIGTREKHNEVTSRAQLQFLNFALRVSRSQPTQGKTFNLFLDFTIYACYQCVQAFPFSGNQEYTQCTPCKTTKQDSRSCMLTILPG